MIRVCTTFSLLLLLAACSNSPQQVKQYYRLATPATSTGTTIDKPVSANNQQQRDSVIITRPEALSILGGRPMVATREDGALVQLNHHYWLDSPKVLLQDRLLEWASQHWHEVLSAGHFIASRDRLQTRILAFEKNQSQAQIQLEFTLYDGINQILLSKTFSKTTKLSSNSFAAFAETADQVVNDMLQQLSQAISELP